MSSEPLNETRNADRPRSHTGVSGAEEQIFTATERLLADVPLHDLSVAQILREAGVSRATFYFYFSSKFAVVTGLLARVMDEIYETVQPFVARRGDREEALRESLEAATNVWRSHRLVLRAAHEHWHAVPELRSLWLEVFAGFTTVLSEQLERERGAGLLVATSPTRTIAALLLWATEGCLYVSGLGADSDLPEESNMVNPLVSLWLGTLYGRAPARRGEVHAR